MAIERHALTDGMGTVVDIIFIDPTGAHGAWPVPTGYTLIDAGSQPVNPGDTWDGKQFACAHSMALCVPPPAGTPTLSAIDAILAAAAATATPQPAADVASAAIPAKGP